MEAVLFLDANWQPLRVEHWHRAITDLFLGKVKIVEYSRDRTIKGVDRDHPMPSVVRIVRHFKRDKQSIKFCRKNICARDGFRCQYCGERKMMEDLTYDHVIPRSHGGKTTWENIVAACTDCNATKANRTPEQAEMKLLKKPVKPKYLPVVSIAMDPRKVPEEWKNYWFVGLEP